LPYADERTPQLQDSSQTRQSQTRQLTDKARFPGHKSSFDPATRPGQNLPNSWQFKLILAAGHSEWPCRGAPFVSQP